MIQLPLLGLVAFSVLLLADDFGRASVWTTRLGSAQTQCARSGPSGPGRTLVDMTTTEQSFLTRRRNGPRPSTTPTNPHAQLTQNAPADLQERVFSLASSLDGVEVGPSHVSVPGARAFHLPESTQAACEAFMVAREFAHLHPSSDGSLHMVLPPEVVDQVIENGWAERHPLAGHHGLPANIVMVYGPHDDDELEVVADLVRASHSLATGSVV